MLLYAEILRVALDRAQAALTAWSQMHLSEHFLVFILSVIPLGCTFVHFPGVVQFRDFLSFKSQYVNKVSGFSSQFFYENSST